MYTYPLSIRTQRQAQGFEIEGISHTALKVVQRLHRLSSRRLLPEPCGKFVTSSRYVDTSQCGLIATSFQTDTVIMDVGLDMLGYHQKAVGDYYLRALSSTTVAMRLDGVEFSAFPKCLESSPNENEPIVVVDMSSNILSRRVDVRRYGCINAGAQKIWGITDLTVVIVRTDLLTTVPSPSFLHTVGAWSPPVVFNWSIIAKNNSLYNTLPIFGVWIAGHLARSCEVCFQLMVARKWQGRRPWPMRKQKKSIVSLTMILGFSSRSMRRTSVVG